MRLIHYNDILIKELENREYKQSDLTWQAKPKGLWFSVEEIGKHPNNYNWKEWCEAENFRIEYLSVAHEITLKEDAKIIHLKTLEEILEFTKKYPYLRDQWKDYIGIELCDSYELDWHKVKQEYQGIIISPYQWDCRLNADCDWYYGWDCSSGCIWDLSCIKEFKEIKMI